MLLFAIDVEVNLSIYFCKNTCVYENLINYIKFRV